MTKLELLDLLCEVRADYAAMWRDGNRRNKKLVTPTDPEKAPLVQRMDAAIRDLTILTADERTK